MTRCGYEPGSGTYYEVLGAGSSERPPWLMLHGGSGTGAVFRLTADGRPGWADALAARGEQVWLVDYRVSDDPFRSTPWVSTTTRPSTASCACYAM
jgi:pimeloyl-ACP methyl ester carboxylesterase